VLYIVYKRYPEYGCLYHYSIRGESHNLLGPAIVRIGDCGSLPPEEYFIDGKKVSEEQVELYRKAQEITQEGSKETGVNLDI